MPFSIVVCGTLVPDPLQTLEPVAGPALKNEMMLPAVLDPWASHALYEAAHLAAQHPGSKIWLVSLGPKAKLQQVMMTVAQKVPFEFLPIDGPASGFADSFETAAALADAIAALNLVNPLIFGGWESASRGAGATLLMVGQRLGITEHFLGVDRLTVQADGSLEILERIEGGRHQVSVLDAPPAVLGWATGYLPEPRNNPQVGMANMRAIMPALQRAKPAAVPSAGLCYQSVTLPRQQRETRIVKNMPVPDIARDLVDWFCGAGSQPAAPALMPALGPLLAEPVLVLSDSPDILSAAQSISTNVRIEICDPASAESAIRSSAATLILALQTSAWARVLPALAVRLNGRIDTHATGIAVMNSVPAVTRWFYRQRMEAILTRSQRPWIVMLEPAITPVDIPTATTTSRTKVVGIRTPAAGEQTIRPDANLLFVAGAGWTKKQSDGTVHGAEAEKLIMDFLRASHASLGGSKSLVDMGGEGEAVLKCMTHLNQIGQTGSTPRHPKGLSTCCHGEEPHVVGWRFITERRAINLDANCGWARGKADVLYVADAFAVIREVNRLLT